MNENDFSTVTYSHAYSQRRKGHYHSAEKILRGRNSFLLYKQCQDRRRSCICVRQKPSQDCKQSPDLCRLSGIHTELHIQTSTDWAKQKFCSLEGVGGGIRWRQNLQIKSNVSFFFFFLNQSITDHKRFSFNSYINGVSELEMETIKTFITLWLMYP